jgi:hypothetical protein
MPAEITPQEMHEKMLAIAATLGLPKHYQNDLLFHDLEALCDMRAAGKTRFWWRLRECGTQFSSHSESYARMAWSNEQGHCYFGDLATGELRLLPVPAERRVR